MDGLEVGVCAFDDNDRTLLWNRTFLQLFPEHARHIHSGEPYSANLRRFYEGRLGTAERPFIERYIEEGIGRHRQQQRPFVFEHRGLRIRSSSLPLPGVGRVRMWRMEADASLVVPAAPSLGGVQSGEFDTAVVLGHLADGLMVADSRQRMTWANEAFLRLYGFTDWARWKGQTFHDAYRTLWDLADVGERERLESRVSVLSENMRFVGAPFTLPLPNGRWVRLVRQNLPDGTGFSTHVDITGLKRQQEQLSGAEERARQTKALLEAALAKMQQGVMMVNSDRIVEVCNRRAIELLELPESLMDSKPSFEEVLSYQWSQGEFRNTSQSLQDFIRAGGIKDQPQTYDRQRPDGTVIEVHSVPIKGGGVLRTYTDITERKLTEERVRHIARHDGLTSLVNREACLEHLAESTRRSAQQPAPRIAVLYIDLDRFKPINDQYGHAVGDEALAIVAMRMRRVARDVDVVARMGGDEFAILQQDVHCIEAAADLARRVLAAISEPIETEVLHLAVGASIGIALFPDDASDVDHLLQNADAAMYVAKGQGGDRVCLFRDLS